MVNRILWSFHCTLLVLAFAGCKDPDPEPLPFDYSGGVMVVNEGNFQGGNASLSYLRLSDDSLRLDCFQAENARPLGDVAQSVCLANGKAYVVVNNSGKIEVLDISRMKSDCSISGMQSPRYLLPIGGGKAFVSDLYSRSIHVLDLNSCSVIQEIPTGPWTEGMVLDGNQAFAVQSGTDQLLRLDVQGISLLDSMTVAPEPNSIVLDRDGQLWVLCGNDLGTVSGHLVRLDPDLMQIGLDLVFGNSLMNPTRPCSNPAGDTLYWLGGGIWRMSIYDNSLPSQPWVAASGHNWYGLAIDPRDDSIYATDAMDYQRRGWLYRFHAGSSSPAGEWQVGVIPGEMAFPD